MLRAPRQDSRAKEVPTVAQTPDEAHYGFIADRILAGAVVPFLGAGVNLCGRKDSESFEVGRHLPSGAELADYLASKGHYPGEDRKDLLRVSQYIAIMAGLRPLYEWLHDVFDADYAPTPAHRLLASLPSMIRTRRSTQRGFFPLIVTTNYDDALETAFKDAHEEYDLVTYMADGPRSGRFLHTRPDGNETVINKPKSYKELQCVERPVIAKIHGAVMRRMPPDPQHDSFVITENHYIDYLSHTDIKTLIPVNIASRMMQSHFLFFGYSLKDWNLRVILHRLSGDAGMAWTSNSWAVQPKPDKIDEKSWGRRGVELLDARLEDYIEQLKTHLANSASATREEAAS
jgi:SIR2-like domain